MFTEPAPERRAEVKMKKLVAAFVGLSTLDMVLTLVFVGNGTSRELNAYMENVLSWPLPGIVAFKVGVPVLFGLALMALAKMPAARRVHPKGALKIIVVMLTLICIFNLGGLIF